MSLSVIKKIRNQQKINAFNSSLIPPNKPYQNQNRDREWMKRRNTEPDRWCRICRTWNGWWCWFYQPIDRLRKRVCIWREVKPSPCVRNGLFSLNEIWDLNESLKNVFFWKRKQKRKRRNERWRKKIHAIFDWVVFIYGAETANHVANFLITFFAPLLSLIILLVPNRYIN